MKEHPVDAIQKTYQCFSPLPLKSEDEELYVHLEDARGHQNPVRRLATRVRLAQQPLSQVLAGHRGSGKSTELIRLKKELEQRGDTRHFVVLCKADEETDLNDVDFIDILIVIVRQLAEQLKTRLSIDLKPSYFRDRFDRLKNLLKREINLESIGLSAGMLDLSATLKASPDTRRDIREFLEPDTSNWLSAANEVIGDALGKLKELNYDGLVIIVDDLDKMLVRPIQHVACNTAEYLFINRAKQLTGFLCHTIYTLPLSLAYSHHSPTIKMRYGGDVSVVPMIKIATRPPQSKVHTDGVNMMQSMIAKRCEKAGIEPLQLFKTQATENKLIQLSGGQPSELMTLIQDAILEGQLPITDAIIVRLSKGRQREYERFLRKDHWPILKEVKATGAFTRTEDNERISRELIDSRAILQYVNDDEWYALNPALQNTVPPAGK